MDQVNTSANPSKIRYYNKLDSDEVDDCCDGVVDDDEDDAQASKIRSAAWWMPFGKFRR
jgi:hypothetical protein